jgi:acetyltransferase-like isoleucine patch superfamily enzyme
MDPIQNFINKICGEGKYYKKIRLLEEKNTKRKCPRSYYVFRFDDEDRKRNALFTSFEVGIKLHMMFRGYLNKIAGNLPPSPFQQWLYKLVGLRIENDVFIAPEFITDILVIGWTKIKQGCSIGLAVKCFNHLFEENGRVLLGYITIGENTSIGGYTIITPGVTIGQHVCVGAGVIIGPGVNIGDHVKIKAGSIIGSFVRIGKCAEVEIGSVVLENVPPYTRVSGNPAKVISKNPRFKKELASSLL